MLDAQIISAVISSRRAYDRIAPHLAAKDFTPVGAFWWKAIREWYERDNGARSVDVAALGAVGLGRVGNPKQREPLQAFLRDLPNDVSASNIAACALELRRRNVGLELAAAIAAGDGATSRRLARDYSELAEATELTSKRQVQWQDATPIDSLFEAVGSEQRIPLSPKCLNERVGGGALPGHHIVLFGRPEVGKSTFSINFAAQLATKHEQRVLYVGNEDAIDVIKARAVARVAKMTHAEVQANRDEAIRRFKAAGGEERLRFVQMFDGGPTDLRQPIEKFEPTILVMDQIRNLAAGETDGIVQRLDENGQAVRRLLLEYGMIGLSVTQAGVSAEGKDWLTMEDLDNSKTGLPGTADLLVGLGASRESMTRGVRGISLPKNKLSSAADAHDSIMIEMDVARGVVR